MNNTYRFASIKETINALDRSKELISDMFEKRNSVPYKYEYAIKAINSVNPVEAVEKLIRQGILEQYEDCVRIGTRYMDFFSAVLDVNEGISADVASQRIQSLKENITYYLKENSADRKNGYIRKIKTTLLDIGDDLRRNTSDLRRNIENVYKTEPNYTIKLSKLQVYEEKWHIISGLATRVQKMILEDEEIAFFNTHIDVELACIIAKIEIQIKNVQNELAEILRHIIAYINKTKQTSYISKKIRTIKRLRDQHELKEYSDIEEVASGRCQESCRFFSSL